MTKAPQKNVGKLAYAGLGACLVMLLAIGILSIWSHLKFRDDFQWVVRTHEAMVEIAQLLSDIQDAETGARGFVLTGREQYLAPVESAKTDLDRNFAELRAATADNPRQQERLDALQPLIDEKLRVVQQLIDARREMGLDAALQIVLSDKGKLVMNQIRRVVQEMNAEEEELLGQRNQSVIASARTTSVTMIGGIALIVGTAIVVTLRVNRDLRARRQAEEAMRQARDQLAEQTEILTSVLRCMGDGVVVADANAKFLIWNPAATHLVGQGAVDVSPDHWTETYGVYLPDGQTPCPTDRLPLVLAIHGEAVDGEMLYLKSD